MKKFTIIAVIALSVNACSSREPENLKSPCVGASGSPCDRTPINQPVNV